MNFYSIDVVGLDDAFLSLTIDVSRASVPCISYVSYNVKRSADHSAVTRQRNTDLTRTGETTGKFQNLM